MEEKRFVVDEKGEGMRLDKYLASKFSDTSRTHIQELIKEDKVRVSHAAKSASYCLKKGDLIEVFLGERKGAVIPLVSLDLPVIYQDRDLIVVDKPIDLIVHPVGKNQDSLIGALMHRGVKLSDISPSRPGVVHRLDKDTSGVMVLAKNNSSHLALVDEFRKRQVDKQYIALVRGIFKIKKGKIDFPLQRLKYKPKMKVGFIKSKESITFYEVIRERGGLSLLSLSPRTGRMHQLRVHLSFLGHPIIGDKKYKGPKAHRLFLHSEKIGFLHPGRKKRMEFTSPPPSIFGEYLENPSART